MRRRISFFVHDLADNPLGRAVALAEALEQQLEVEILGLLLSGTKVCEPYRGLFPYKSLRCGGDILSVLRAAPKLAAMASGDVVYGCKPLITSYYPALLASGWGRRKPLLLDVEDDEWSTLVGTTWPQFVYRYVFKGWRHAISWKYTLLLHLFTGCAAGASVSSTKLRRRYGGRLVRHGPNENVFNPARADLADKFACRIRFGLPTERHLALFAGTPRPHKGVPTLLEALRRDECRRWDLVLIGPQDHPDFRDAAARLGTRSHLLGYVARADMPAVLAAVDAAPVPQVRTSFTESQVPAKLLDAMAMAKPVVASRVGDIAEILGNGSRGWLFEPGDGGGLARALGEIAEKPAEAQRRGQAAREWYLKEASATVTATRICALLEEVTGREVSKMSTDGVES